MCSDLGCVHSRQGAESLSAHQVWVVWVGGHDGELRPWHFIYVYRNPDQVDDLNSDHSPRIPQILEIFSFQTPHLRTLKA